MHPLLGYRRRMGLYLLAWVPVTALLAGLLHAGAGADWFHAVGLALPLALVFAFGSLSQWYICRVLPLGSTLSSALAAQLATAVAAGGLWALLAQGLALSFGWRVHAAAMVWILGGLLSLLSAAGYYLLMAIERAGESERQALAAVGLAREAELRALKSQINPHFLFNSLNSISALTSADAGRARQMCVLLGDFLRRTLALSGRDERALVPLREELDLIAAFLAVEQVRFGERLEVAHQIEEGVLDLKLPPLLLQPLVENAVVHGIAPRIEGGRITIAAKRVGGEMRLQVRNPVDQESVGRGSSGVGLANVRGRLQALFAGSASLAVERTSDSFCATLVLPALLPEVAP